MLYFLFVLAYFLALGHFVSIWDSKIKEQWHQLETIQNTPSTCTLMVPFRNEDDNLGLLLPDLSENLPSSANVCFIDDHSEDNGAERVKQFIENHNLVNWQIINNQGIGKKAALNTGIQASKSEIIVTTDADVRINKGWLEHLISPFMDPAIRLVAAPVMTSAGNGVFSDFQQIEWASLILMTQVSFAKGKPLMCSGANLAFRKKAFLEVEGYEGNTHIPSGDDEFLLKKMWVKFGASALDYLVSPLSLVKTHALKSPLDWIRQRSRWASKWNAHKGSWHWLSAAGLAVFSTFLLASIPLAFYSWEYTLAILLFWTLRVIFEKKVLGKILNLFGLKFSFLSWFLTGWIYPLLVLCALPFAIFGNYTWKGRKS